MHAPGVREGFVCVATCELGAFLHAYRIPQHSVEGTEDSECVGGEGGGGVEHLGWGLWACTCYTSVVTHHSATRKRFSPPPVAMPMFSTRASQRFCAREADAGIRKPGL